MGYKTLFEQIKTVCAWNSLNSSVPNESRYGDYFPLHFAMIHVLYINHV